MNETERKSKSAKEKKKVRESETNERRKVTLPPSLTCEIRACWKCLQRKCKDTVEVFQGRLAVRTVVISNAFTNFESFYSLARLYGRFLYSRKEKKNRNDSFVLVSSRSTLAPAFERLKYFASVHYMYIYI